MSGREEPAPSLFDPKAEYDSKYQGKRIRITENGTDQRIVTGRYHHYEDRLLDRGRHELCIVIDQESISLYGHAWDTEKPAHPRMPWQMAFCDLRSMVLIEILPEEDAR